MPGTEVVLECSIFKFSKQGVCFGDKMWYNYKQETILLGKKFLVASVAESVDALDSKSNCSNTVRVQVSSEALIIIHK